MLYHQRSATSTCVNLSASANTDEPHQPPSQYEISMAEWKMKFIEFPAIQYVSHEHIMQSDVDARILRLDRGVFLSIKFFSHLHLHDLPPPIQFLCEFSCSTLYNISEVKILY